MRRWLPWLAAVENELQAATSARLMADDRNRVLQADNDRLRDEVDALRKDAVTRTEKITDWVSQRFGQPALFGNPYDNKIQTPEPVRARSVQASRLESEAFRDIENELLHPN